MTGGEDATAPIAAMLRRTGLPVLYRSAGAAGVLIDRLRWPMLREMIHLLDEGATPIQIDRALLGFGFTIAPLAALDREGIGAMMAACIDARGSTASWPRYSPTLDLMIDAGRHLAAPNQGFYRYEEGSRTPLPDPAFERLLHNSAMAQRLPRRIVSDAEIVERCMLAAINEAAAALEDGAAADAASIDALWTHVLGFPRWRGGPLYDADQRGLPAVVTEMNHIAAMHRTIPPPVVLLSRAATAGSRLTWRPETNAEISSTSVTDTLILPVVAKPVLPVMSPRRRNSRSRISIRMASLPGRGTSAASPGRPDGYGHPSSRNHRRGGRAASPSPPALRWCRPQQPPSGYCSVAL